MLMICGFFWAPSKNGVAGADTATPGCKMKFELSRVKKIKRNTTSMSGNTTSHPKLCSLVRTNLIAQKTPSTKPRIRFRIRGTARQVNTNLQIGPPSGAALFVSIRACQAVTGRRLVNSWFEGKSTVAARFARTGDRFRALLETDDSAERLAVFQHVNDLNSRALHFMKHRVPPTGEIAVADEGRRRHH